MPGAAKSLCCCCSCFCTALRSFTCKRSSSKMNFPGLFGHDCTVLDMLAILHHITVYSNFRYKLFIFNLCSLPGSSYRGVRGWNRGGLVVSTWRMGYDVLQRPSCVDRVIRYFAAVYTRCVPDPPSSWGSASQQLHLHKR